MLVGLIELTGSIRRELERQVPYQALDANWFKPGSAVVRLVMTLVRWSVPLGTFLPYAQVSSTAQTH